MRFIVTAGPTREYLDPVRYLSNPSSGLTGFAVARAALRAGHEAILVAGPGVVCKTPHGLLRFDVVSARDMCRQVLHLLSQAQNDGVRTALVMTAAVADWRPAERFPEKMKKSPSMQEMTLRLVRNPDILMEVAKSFSEWRGLVRIGFAAETGDPSAEAVRKCKDKHLDMVVGNDVTASGCGFGTRTNKVVFAFPDGRIESLPMLSKAALANRIVKRFAGNAHGK